MEEKITLALNLTTINDIRVQLRRKLSLFDLNLRQVAEVLLSPEEFAKWAGTQPIIDTPQSPRIDKGRPFASPRGTERSHVHLQVGVRKRAPVDELAVPCRLPHFLGDDHVSVTLGNLFAHSSSKGFGKSALHRLSTLSPRTQKQAEMTDGKVGGEMVVAVLRELLMYRQDLDAKWVPRAFVGRDQLESQLAIVQAQIETMGRLLSNFGSEKKEAFDLCKKIRQLQIQDELLYSTVLSWLDMKAPNKTTDQAPYRIHLHAVDIADLLRSQLGDAEVLLAVSYGVDANEAVAYSNERWQLAPSRLPEALNDRRLLKLPEHAWAAGGMASVHKLTYKGSPEPVCVVWKAEDAKAGSLGTDAMGITSTDARAGIPPQYGARAVASFRVADLLKLNLIPKTEWAVHQGQLGTAMALAGGLAPSSKGPFHLALDAKHASALKQLQDALPALAKRFRFASVAWSDTTEHTLVFDDYLEDFVFDNKGVRIQDANGPVKVKRRMQVWVVQDFDHPAVRRELVRLQWLDHLTGQVDRNPMNYLVDSRQDGGVSIAAIDNDLSFPAVSELPTPSGANAIWLPAMPTIVDQTLANAILATSDEAWQKCLHGLMTPAEFHFADQRLKSVKKQIEDLVKQGRVVSADDKDWASAQMAACLGLEGIDQRVRDASDDRALEGIWVDACQHSYLKRDAIKQAMVLSGRDPVAYFDPDAVRRFVRDELLTG